ncbi:hypothetical protein E2C01_015124 [Portunus trituberculatus]|uniref:Uncharacterized protein n=1 Tax=Portunus trituberculatus TaxID=210409 RepID=A0A5B7DLW1_PORTR|nr:hypothetical protein [Portunus trituberculatus]
MEENSDRGTVQLSCRDVLGVSGCARHQRRRVVFVRDSLYMCRLKRLCPIPNGRYCVALRYLVSRSVWSVGIQVNGRGDGSRPRLPLCRPRCCPQYGQHRCGRGLTKDSI